MVDTTVTGPDGREYVVAHPEGASQSQIIDFARKQAPQPPDTSSPGRTVVRIPEAPQAPAAPQDSPGALGKALEPITSYPETYGRIRGEAQEQAGAGLSELFKGTKAKVGKGLWDTGFGTGRFITSPIEAGLETVVGKPLEENLGIPKEYSTFAAGLALPVYGLSRAPGQAAAHEFNKVFRPEAIGAGKVAAASIRQATGTAARETAGTEAQLDQYHRLVNTMPDTERLDLMHYMEGAGSAPTNPQAQQLADTLKTAFEQRKTRLQNLSSTATMNFVQDYFPHMWKNPQQAQQFAQSWAQGMGKQGSGLSLRARTMPTIQDGLNAGLQLENTNPIETALRYVTSMDKFIAQTEMFETAAGNGTIVYARPKVFGASGNPQAATGIPPGYVPLKGRGSTNAAGQQAYAPEHWARVYNNFLSRGFHESPTVGDVYDAARKASNAVTAVELSLSGYHAFTMTNEAIINNVARSFQQASGGSFMEAVKTLLKAPAAPITSALKGHAAEKIYTGLSPGNQQSRNLVDILTEAGARMKGKRHAPDLEVSRSNSLVTAWRRGALKSEMQADWQKVQQGWKPGTGVVLKNIGRVMETAMQPLFEKYIPKLKNGAAMENLADWIKRHPGSTREEQVAAAREIWDSIDNRFGEMVQDNIFWDNMVKQTATVGLRSYSWTMGSIREIAGGVKDVVSPKAGAELSQRTAYTMALPMVYGSVSAIYQYLKTGEPPKDTQDLVAPRTGGTDPGTEEPERIIPPGYMKDVFGWLEHPGQEAANKVGTFPRTMGELFSNQDWRGDPIRSPADPDKPWPTNVPRWLSEYMGHVSNLAVPIPFKRGSAEGTGLSAFERAMGMQPAGRRYTDPEGFSDMMRNIEERKWRGKLRHDEAEKQKYGGVE